MSGVEQLLCCIRKEKVVATAEERVRQSLLAVMLQQLGYPASQIAVEQSLHQLPHVAIKGGQVPLRRADIICFARGIHPDYALYPLLLIECKAIKISPQSIRQVSGYNHYLGALFIALASCEGVYLGWLDATQNRYRFVDGLPSYSELLRCLKEIR